MRTSFPCFLLLALSQLPQHCRAWQACYRRHCRDIQRISLGFGDTDRKRHDQRLGIWDMLSADVTQLEHELGELELVFEFGDDDDNG